MKITHLTGTRTGQGFTLVELIVVIGIIGLLTALAFPALKKAREAAGGSKCLGQLRQMGMAALSYANDNNGFLPPTYDANTRIYFRLLNPYLGTAGDVDVPLYPKIYKCPLDKAPFLGGIASYGANSILAKTTPVYNNGNIYRISKRSGTLLYIDTDNSSSVRPGWGGGYERIAFRHNGMANAVMTDASVRAFSQKTDGLLDSPVSPYFGTPGE